jgi:hypothetical protein
VHHKCIYFSPKTKVNHNVTPPFLLPLTNPLYMVVCQPPLVGSGEHYFLIKYGEKVSASVGCIRLLYSTNWANYTTLLRARTHKTQQHTTTNMSRRCPTHQRLRSSLSMATSAMDLYLGAAAPYGSEAGAGHSVRSRHCRFHQLEHRNRAHKKLRDAPVSGLRWPPFRDFKQQSTQ